MKVCQISKSIEKILLCVRKSKRGRRPREIFRRHPLPQSEFLLEYPKEILHSPLDQRLECEVRSYSYSASAFGYFLLNLAHTSEMNASSAEV